MPGLLGTSLNTDDILETLRGIGRGLNFGGTSGMIGAPVDMATAVLNNPGLLHPGLLGVQGLGIKDPVGGSKWIEQKLQGQGLLPKRQGNWQEGVGELASTFINPMTAAAVAGPKLYAIESKMLDNAMAPTTLNKQAGAIVWHGSPHKFDKFDSKKIGTGEGAQAYGHGLYFAESPAVAGNYRNVLSDTLEVKGSAQPLEKRAAQMALTFGDNTTEGALQWLSKFEGKGANHVSPAMTPELVRQVKQKFQDGTFSQGGALYKVDLPDTAIAKMLDWDKPLSQQAKNVQDAWRGIYGEFGMPVNENELIGPTAMRSMLEPDLLKRGIPGIRYLDGGSRGAGSGTSNFVVFPGNEDLLRILERNGQPIGLLGR